MVGRKTRREQLEQQYQYTKLWQAGIGLRLAQGWHNYAKMPPAEIPGGVTGRNQVRRKIQFGAEVTGHTQRRIEYHSIVICWSY
jgi:hypothetical protein